MSVRLIGELLPANSGFSHNPGLRKNKDSYTVGIIDIGSHSRRNDDCRNLGIQLIVALFEIIKVSLSFEKNDFRKRLAAKLRTNIELGNR